MVTARFVVGTSSDAAILRVHEKVRANMDRIPVGVPEPLIVGRGIDDVAILALTLSPTARRRRPHHRERPDPHRPRAALRGRQDRERRPDLPRRRDRRDDPHRPRPGAAGALRRHAAAARRQGRGRQLAPSRPAGSATTASRSRWSPARRCAAPRRSATCWSPPATTGRSTCATSPTSVFATESGDALVSTVALADGAPQRVPVGDARHRQARRLERRHRRRGDPAPGRGPERQPDPRRHRRRGHPQLRRDRQREGERAPLPPRPRHHLDHRPGRLRHRLARGASWSRSSSR